jgi:excisionase family DNA binding protein
MSLYNIQRKGTELLTRKEAATYLGVTESTLAVWACVKRYNLPYVKVGRLVKYRRSDLEAFIERRMVSSTEI